MQTVARYLVDKRGLSYTDAARLLGRSPKSIWASYHQAAPLEIQDSDQEPTIDIPISIFNGELPPLEALVRHLKTLGLRNVDIAKALGLDPRTVWTTAKRSEARS
jgi:DNA-directed RNA polymerase specialized sigma24 family protein